MTRLGASTYRHPWYLAALLLRAIAITAPCASREGISCKEQILAEVAEKCEFFNFVLLAKGERGAFSTTDTVNEVWRNRDNRVKKGDTFERPLDPGTNGDSRSEIIIFLSNFPPSGRYSIWRTEQGRLQQCPELSIADVREAAIAHKDKARAIPMQAIHDAVGKPTESEEFIRLKEALGLTLVERRQKFYGKTGVRSDVLYEIYEGSGLRAFSQESTWFDRAGNVTRKKAATVGKIQLVFRESREAGFLQPLWKGELPFADLPRNPQEAKQRFGQPESDMQESRNSLFRDDGPVSFGNTRRLDYHWQFASEDRFPYCLVFENDELTIIEVYPGTNKIVIIPPTLPEIEVKK